MTTGAIMESARVPHDGYEKSYLADSVVNRMAFSHMFRARLSRVLMQTQLIKSQMR